MTAQEQRGKWLFLALATAITLEKLSGVIFALSGGLGEVKWLRSVAEPVAFIGAIAFLWYGDDWLRRVVGYLCLISGGLLVFVSGRALAALAAATDSEHLGILMQLAGYPLGVVALHGLLYIVAGLLFLFSPSMRAFFRYQREGP